MWGGGRKGRGVRVRVCVRHRHRHRHRQTHRHKHRHRYRHTHTHTHRNRHTHPSPPPFAQASCRVVCASPSANGFLGARGPRGHIPAAYTHILLTFLQALTPQQLQRIRVMEYEREGWTFHAKGACVTPMLTPVRCVCVCVCVSVCLCVLWPTRALNATNNRSLCTLPSQPPFPHPTLSTSLCVCDRRAVDSQQRYSAATRNRCRLIKLWAEKRRSRPGGAGCDCHHQPAPHGHFAAGAP